MGSDLLLKPAESKDEKLDFTASKSNEKDELYELIDDEKLISTRVAHSSQRDCCSHSSSNKTNSVA